MDEKYIVFKRDHIDKVLTTVAHRGLTPEAGAILNEILEGALPDAVVIRRQDVFAPPALDAYANSITVALSMDPEAKHSDWGQNLQDIADYFHSQAKMAWETDRKVPD